MDSDDELWHAYTQGCWAGRFGFCMSDCGYAQDRFRRAWFYGLMYGKAVRRDKQNMNRLSELMDKVHFLELGISRVEELVEDHKGFETVAAGS